ncbi:helix-turn-helix domain-containing protein [Kribbella catacumbae]|uniref:helix-turn-helix domain-containing protein n=1 Tax=Kribbella catacumbae TaxID=460086 RepID=UPI00035C5A90|nr:helix-turn-helix domain-containing protein [Kribbella catacumbae]
MTVIDQWTGRHARALQAAMRLTGEAFAEHLGVSPRTVAKWRKRPDMVPSPQLQEALDTSLNLASPEAQTRFAASIGVPQTDQPSLDDSTVDQLHAALGELSRILAVLQTVDVQPAGRGVATTESPGPP